MSRKRRVVHEEEHENHERWLVTYADMVTLLMVLFIVMFAMSQVDQKKFNALRAGLAAGFGQSTSVLDGSSSILSEPGMAAAQPIAPQKYDLTELDQVDTSNAEASRSSAARTTASAEVSRLSDILAHLQQALRKHGLEDDVRSTIDDRGLVLSLVSRHVVFEPNLASLTARGRATLDTLAPVLRDLPDPLEIDGHTNQVKVKPKYFATDWDLSAARAITVLRYLNEATHIPNGRLRASAFGHERPLIDPSQAGSQALNKRVDIVILTSIPPEGRALLASIASQQNGAAS